MPSLLSDSEGMAMKADSNSNRYRRKDEMLYELDVAQSKLQQTDRVGWANRREFLLSCIGYAVGLGNIWRFPWLAQKNGGGAFLIPYFVMLFLEGIPVFYMELTIGQRMQSGPLQIWSKTSRYSKGIGWAQTISAITGNTSYVLVVAWSIYYLVSSFQSPLPWAACPTETYFDVAANQTTKRAVEVCSKLGVTQYYWYYKTLNISSGMLDFGGFSWKLALCLVAAWTIVALSLLKGIRSSGKVVYFTALFPYVVLSIFFVLGFFLDGYEDGLRHLITPQWHRLADHKVWLEAAAQIFYTLSIGSGGLLTYGSYNPIQQDTLKDTFIIVGANCFTSIFAGVTVFCMLGFRANYLSRDCTADNVAMVTQLYTSANATIQSQFNNMTAPLNTTAIDTLVKGIVAQQRLNVTLKECSVQSFLDKSSGGSGLAFVAMTEAINQLPAASFFSVLFFLMLITLGLDSLFGGVEAVATSMKDSKVFGHIRREFIVLFIAVLSTLIGLIYVTHAGEYYLQLNNSYGTDIPKLMLVFCELITVCYLYGINRFTGDIKFMMGRDTSIVWRVMWMFVSPVLIAGLLIMFLVGTFRSSATYEAWNRTTAEAEKVPYSHGALAMAIGLFVLITILVPAFAIYELCKRFMCKRGRDVSTGDIRLTGY